MISYYLLVAVVDVLTAVNEDDWQIAADIREGNISQFLLKPMDYLWYRLCLFISGRVTFMAVAVVPLVIFIACFGRYFVLPPSGAAFGVFLISLLLTASLQFFISYAMALLAFWVLEISTFIFILFAFEYLASGHMFPLDICRRPSNIFSISRRFRIRCIFRSAFTWAKSRAWICCGECWCRRAGCWWRMVSRGLCGNAASGIMARLEDDKMSSKSEVQSPKSFDALPSTGYASPVTRYFAIYAALWKTSVTREMSFKGNFILWIVVELLWFALQLCFISVLYLHTNPSAPGRNGRWCCWSARAVSSSKLSGVFLDKLCEPVGTRPHRQNGFPADAAGEHAFRRLVAAGGSRRVCEWRVCGRRHGLCRGKIGFAPDRRDNCSAFWGCAPSAF